MRRFTYAVVIMLVIVYNFYVFIYGVFQQYRSHVYYVEAQKKCMLDSGLVVALHYYEDSDKKIPIEKNTEINETPVSYNIKEIDANHISIKIWLPGTKDYFEYGMKK